MNYIAKAALNNSIQSVKSAMTPQSQSGPKINWDDFNYPPLLKVFHYDIAEVEPENRLTVRALWLSHVLISIESILNIINNIAIATAVGTNKVRILYSFMFLFSFNPLACFIFYRGYRGICDDPFLLTLYKWLQILLIIAWIIFSVVPFLGFNGFSLAIALINVGLPFQGILAFIESSIYLLTAALSTYALCKVCGKKN